MKSDRDWIPARPTSTGSSRVATPVHPVLAEIEAAAEPDGIPIVDRDTGRVLAALAADRRRIVEVGTAFGYSTLWMALGQPADGTIVTIDPDASRTDLARELLAAGGDRRRADHGRQRAGARRLPRRRPGARRPVRPRLHRRAQARVPAYLEALVPRLAPGALVVADNVLWSGRTSGARPSRPGDRTADPPRVRRARSLGRSALRRHDPAGRRRPARRDVRG